MLEMYISSLIEFELEKGERVWNVLYGIPSACGFFLLFPSGFLEQNCDVQRLNLNFEVMCTLTLKLQLLSAVQVQMYCESFSQRESSPSKPNCFPILGERIFAS